MQALVTFSNGNITLVKVNSSYSLGGVHYYNLTLNALSTFLDFSTGETKLFIEADITKLTYVMS